MKKRNKLEVNFTNRWLYIFIILAVIVVIAVGIYALTPGVAPNPGHLLSDISPPAGCTAGQFIQFNGSNWVCVTISVPTALYGLCTLVDVSPPGSRLLIPLYGCSSASILKEPAYCSGSACACRSGYTRIYLGDPNSYTPSPYSCSKN